MDTQQVALIAALFFLISTLYSSVGHGGASGYIAVMALLGLPTDMIRPVALTLNIVVAGLAAIRFSRAGHSDWKAALPLVATSVPLAFLGGTVTLPTDIYRPLLGVLLLISAAYLVWQSVSNIRVFELTKPRVPLAGGLSVGGVIGFISGVSGIGGGVILSPLMLTLKWANVRQTSAIAALFIVVNSSSGLAGKYCQRPTDSRCLTDLGRCGAGRWLDRIGTWREKAYATFSCLVTGGGTDCCWCQVYFVLTHALGTKGRSVVFRRPP